MPSSARLYFLADDLSGALEAGATLHRLGQPIHLTLDSAITPACAPGTILGYDLNSRVMAADAAYAAVHDLTTRLHTEGIPLLAKKVDSTMRGWIGREIQAILDSGSADAVALCPANPGAGRTVEKGVLLLEGVPVDQTPFNRDPAFPIRRSHIEAIVRTQTDARLGLCTMDTVQSGADGLSGWIRKGLDLGTRILCFDACSDRDLSSITQAISLCGSNILPCGSAAMVAAAGKARGLGTRPDPGTSETAPSAKGHRTLFMIGSANPCSLAQSEVLQRDRPVSVCHFDPGDRSSWSNSISGGIESLGENDVVLMPRVTPDEYQRQRTSTDIQAYFRRFAHAIKQIDRPVNCFITGGETARTVIDTLQLTSMEIVHELEPGVSVSIVSTHGSSQSQPGRTIIIKPGGFGGPDTLVNCYDYLAQSPRPRT